MTSENKRTVERYIDGFNRTDHESILACLSDDVEWVIPGFFHTRGKEEFDGEIENDEFEGSPSIEIVRLVEENEVVVAEGKVSSRRADGSAFSAVFCDVFEMGGGKIRRLTSYLVPLG